MAIGAAAVAHRPPVPAVPLVIAEERCGIATLACSEHPADHGKAVGIEPFGNGFP